MRAAYQRLTERFRTLWLFHQFLQGIQAVLPAGEPVSAGPEFGPLYERIKAVKESRESRESAELLAEIERLQTTLDGLHATLLVADRRVPPHVLRQFFEKTGRDEEKDLVPLLRFYFYAKQLLPDDLDKIDFLLTRVGSRRLADGGLELRPEVELETLSTALLALTQREPTDPVEVRSVVNILEVLRKDIEACGRFEDLIRKKPLENIRTLKRRMGNVFYSAEVLQALLASNVAAKRKFQALYRQEEERILATSQHLLELEAELGIDPRFQTDEFQADFRRFRREREDFEKQSKRRGVRPRDVRRLKEAIHRILSRVEPSSAADFDGTSDSTAGGRPTGRRAHREPAPGPPTPAPARAVPDVDAAWRAEEDPLTLSAATRILHTADMAGGGAVPGRPVSGETVQRLRLEPWEFRAALALARLDETPSRAPDAVARLLFNAAALRLRMDEEAAALRLVIAPRSGGSPSRETQTVTAACLARAQEVDWAFRAALQEAVPASDPERHLQLTRSRFRHLRAYTGLWLLHNALGG